MSASFNGPKGPKSAGKGVGNPSRDDAGNDPTDSAPKPVRLLVIQMARLGDTLQTLMALRAAKQLYPQLEIHFVARERFAVAAKRVPWIKQVIALPTESLLGPIMRGEKSERETLPEVAKWLSPLVSDNEDGWDMLINWSYSESSSWLAAILPARIKLGYSRRVDGSLSAIDGWSHYIQAVVQGKAEQNIHLTDILTTQLLTALQIHVGEPLDDGNAPVTSRGFFSLQIGENAANGAGAAGLKDQRKTTFAWRDSSKRWIGIQLGASHDSKTWSPERFGKLAGRILRNHGDCHVVLLGGTDDLERAKVCMQAMRAEFESHDSHENLNRRVLSMVGQTDFDLWAYIVSKCQWLFGADTSAIHLASVLGTRVLNFSIGPVRWAETGPYGNGHYVVASNLPCGPCKTTLPNDPEPHTCRDDITPDAAYAVWTYAEGEWAHRRALPIETHMSERGLSRDLMKLRIYRSKIRNTNEGGGVFYEPLIKRPIVMSDWMSKVMGHIARSWYCGWVPPTGQELTRETISPSLIQTLRKTEDSTGVMLRILDEARRTSTLLSGKSAKLKSQKLMGVHERQEIQQMGSRLQELDELLDRLAKSDKELAPFTQMLRVLTHNIKGEQISDLSRESALCYKQVNEGVTILRDWIKHTLELAKPVAISTTTVVSLKPANKEITT